MINHEYLPYWIEITEKIDTLEQSIKMNLDIYLRTQNVAYLEVMQQDLVEILRLRPILDNYYQKTFNRP